MFRRKHQANESTLPAPPDSRRSTTSSNSPFSLAKTLSGTTLADNSTSDLKGPLGLNLLFSPGNPLIDLIFVHGLGGGSRKTWSKSALPSHYWPQEWLPNDPAFNNVRIHSYGYDSDYLSGKGDALNIHHLGKSFLGEVSTSPYITESQTRIVAIGHSMGGLVIKKAIILARQDESHCSLADRFAAVYFLATPHRGADSAKVLKNMLRAVYDRAYVTDLERGSGSIQVINDEFRHFSANLELWSFYETRNMKLFSSLVVDTESAVLGYREETQMPMSADHRSICKFESESDTNYIILRNALASTVGNIVMSQPPSDKLENRDQLGDLRRYLRVPDTFEDDVITAQEARMPGTCQWITEKDNFAEWIDGKPRHSHILWIRGKPAAGKSVLAGYVVDRLHEAGYDCSYFFFKHRDNEMSRLRTCLRTLAFQMASSSTESRNKILGMQRDGTHLEDLEERALWRMLFLSGIFRTTVSTQYWVIDAIDECSNSLALFDILSKPDGCPGLRVLVTSRDTPHLHQNFSALTPDTLQTFAISASDTLSDIRNFVGSKTGSLPVIGTEDRSLLAKKIIDKSQGSFLWTILVLGELRRCHSKKEIDHILEDIPTDMGHMYKRILGLMSQSTRGKELAKTVLLWVTCAVRPMTVDELHGALSLDLEDTFPQLKESISSLCGQLVAVDKFDKVHMVHETAREFLLTPDLDSEFAVNKRRSHTRIAEGCLKYLTGEEMKPPRTNRRRAIKRSSFAAYAHTAYSYHLSRADPLENGLLESVGRFLNLNILTWVEAISRSPGPDELISVSRHLRMYYDSCCSERSPLHPVLRSLRQWAADLSRIAAKFANALSTYPPAIYSLIPPLCPTESMIHGVGGQGRKLTVLGAQAEEWDDRISCVNFREGQPSALCYGDKFLAIGLTKGAVALYDSTSYQEHRFLDHGEAVKFIRFKGKTNLMITCGMKMTKVWDAETGEVLHNVASPQRPLDVAVYNSTLLVATHKNYIVGWDLDDDARPIPEREWTDSPDFDSPPTRRPPCAVSISTGHGMLAVSYSGEPITLWDLEEDAYYGTCGKKLPSGEISRRTVVVALAFNPNPNIGLIAATYLDGDLALFDLFAGEQLECFRANCQELGASPDGRFLAAGGAEGMVSVYEFDMLRLLYRVKAYSSYIKQLSFANDSLHFADIRGAQCSVWEPAALARYSLNDDSTGSTSASIVHTVSLDSKAKVTAIAVHHTAEVVFSGRDDGAILLYCCKTAKCMRTLYSHKSPIRLLVWCQRRDALVSVDASNRIYMYEVLEKPATGWSTGTTMLFQSRLHSESAIIDVLLGEEAGGFIVSTRESDHLFKPDGSLEADRIYQGVSGNRKWIPHPKSPLHVMCFNATETRTYRWGNWSEIACHSLPTENGKAQLKSVTVFHRGKEHGILLELCESRGSRNTSSVMAFSEQFPLTEDGSEIKQPDEADTAASLCSGGNTEREGISTTTTSLTAVYTHQLARLSQAVSHIIGVSEMRKLVFLDRDSWVSSADLRETDLDTASGSGLSTVTYSRHFFIPNDWFSGRRDIVCALAQRDITFARGGDLVVVRGWLENAVSVPVE